MVQWCAGAPCSAGETGPTERHPHLPQAPPGPLNLPASEPGVQGPPSFRCLARADHCQNHVLPSVLLATLTPWEPLPASCLKSLKHTGALCSQSSCTRRGGECHFVLGSVEVQMRGGWCRAWTCASVTEMQETASGWPCGGGGAGATATGVHGAGPGKRQPGTPVRLETAGTEGRRDECKGSRDWTAKAEGSRGRRGESRGSRQPLRKARERLRGLSSRLLAWGWPGPHGQEMGLS